MTVRRFVGVSSREAMRQVRATLGDDALILANRNTESGIEILAMAEGDSHAQAPVEASPPRSTAPAPSGPAVERKEQGADAAPAQEALLAAHERLLREVQEMREMLNASRQEAPQPQGTESGDDGRGEAVRQRVLAAGFGRGIADEVKSAIPADLKPGPAANAWLSRQLGNRLQVVPDAFAELDAGGVLALIGPTGVGKTTTAAKLAAHYAMRHGSDGIALVSADHYRVGARDQLRVYAELLGVAMHALEPGDNLADLPRELAEKPLVIIDTAGMGQRDERLVEQMSQLAGSRRSVRGLLMVNAAAHAENLDDTVTAYRSAARSAGTDIRGAIITKMDEAPRLGPALATVMRHGLALQFVAHGQRVPEDLAPAMAEDLVTEALMASGAEAAEEEVRGAADPLDRSLTLQSTWSALCSSLDGLEQLERGWAGDVPEIAPGMPAGSTLLAWSRDRSPYPLAFDAGGQVLASPGADCRVRDLPRQAEGRSLLLAAVPDSHTWLSLLEQGVEWIASASHNTRVRHGGEALSMTALRPLAAAGGATTVQFRGRQVQLRLRRAAVWLTAGGRRRRCSGALNGWIGELRHLDTGAVLSRRYWLAPRELSDERCAALFAQQLSAEDFFSQRRKALDKLSDRLPGWRGQPALLGFVAHGIAALANRLERDNSEWALDIRAQLLALSGRQRRLSADALQDTVIQLFSQREALRRLALAVPAGNA